MVEQVCTSVIQLKELIKTMQVAQYMVSGVCFASFNTLVDIEEPFTATITANGQTVERWRK
jgi:ribulose kinase